MRLVVVAAAVANVATPVPLLDVKRSSSCFLQATRSALFDMQLNGIVTNQTSQLAIDFVAYNGHVDLQTAIQAYSVIASSAPGER